jgi:hypothetical protein
MATFEKLIENAKAELKLKAEREAEARAPRVAGRVSQPYAIVRPWLSPRQPTLEAPCIPMSTDYVAPAVADADTYHQRLNGSGVARTYSLEQADWVLRPALVSGADFKRVSPKAVLCSVTATRQIVDERPNPKVNPGRVAQVRSTHRGPLSDNDPFAIQASRKVKTLNPGRGAEMLITDRPVAQPRPVFTRRHAHVYALHRSAAYVSSLHALRDAILRPIRVESEVADCRRHVEDARFALGAKHHALLSGRLA